MKKVSRGAGRSPALARQQPLAQMRTEGTGRWTRYLRGRVVEFWRDLVLGDHLNVRNGGKGERESRLTAF